MLGDGIQRRALLSTPEQRNENINVNISSPQVEIEPTTSRFTGTLCAPAPRLAYYIRYNNHESTTLCLYFIKIDSVTINLKTLQIQYSLNTFKCYIYVKTKNIYPVIILQFILII